jgi:hypothetical protein
MLRISKMTQIFKGSIVCGKSGKPLEVVAIDEGKVVVKSGNDLLRVARSAILQVLSSPPPEPTGIEIGDRLARSTQAKKPYPKGWFPNGIDDRPTTVDAISATVTGFSADGYWANTDEGKEYHISGYSIECGGWKIVRQNNQQN